MQNKSSEKGSARKGQKSVAFVVTAKEAVIVRDGEGGGSGL